MRNKLIKEIAIFLLFYAVFTIVISVLYIVRKFGEINAEQILFHLNVTLVDTSPALKKLFLKNCGLYPFILAVGAYITTYQLKTFNSFDKLIDMAILLRDKFSKRRVSILLVILLLSLLFAFWKLKFYQLLVYAEFIKTNSTDSQFYESYYSPPPAALSQLRFKKNLLIIMMEGMESDYVNGEKNLLPLLSGMAKENQNTINFSDTSSFGGAVQAYGAIPTVNGLISYYCGVPLRLPLRANALTGYKKILPNARCLPDILADAGYEQLFFMGSDKNFSGIGAFLEMHGKLKVKDFDYFRESGQIPFDYHVNWGVEDAKLYSFAKSELEKLGGSKNPFALTMMTLDTHGPYFVDFDRCPEFAENRELILIEKTLRCADKQAYEFLQWLAKQDFYKDTAIFILGDHLERKVEHRRVFNLVINSPLKPKEISNRFFTHFDFFPTMLDAIGFNIPDNKLALGTSLLRDESTVLEKYRNNIARYNLDLSKRSKVYDSLLYPKVD